MRNWESRKEIRRVAVLGAGNGGCAAAVHLLQQGRHVHLYSRSKETLSPIRERGGIQYTGCIGEGLAQPQVITHDIDEAIEDVDLILICIPACGHEYYARLLAPRLVPGSLVVLNPGQTGGSLHFAQILREQNPEYSVVIGETVTLTYGCRLTGPAFLWLYRIKPKIPFATYPGKDAEAARQYLAAIYPDLAAASNVLETGLMNPNAMMHPVGMLLNAGWIEHTKGDFRFYSEGLSPSVASIADALDRERLGIIRSLNERANLRIPALSLIQQLHQIGYTSDRALESESMYQAFQDSEPNRPLKAPALLRHRYLVEDVPFGLVPLASLGNLVDAETRKTQMMIGLASSILGEDFWQTGRTVEKMGLTTKAFYHLEQSLWEGGILSE